MSILEMYLTDIFYEAKSVSGCRKAMIKLDVLERTAGTVEEFDMVRDSMDFLMVKGNLMILEAK
jgi:hypothetical protein